MPPALTEIPHLKRGCRLSATSAPDSLLLIPEGALRLKGPSRRILELCDGQRSLAGIVSVLEKEFTSAEPGRVSHEVVSFLAALQQKGVIEFL
jgi:pyrroloquinoline quinone biosynthesis protein D